MEMLEMLVSEGRICPMEVRIYIIYFGGENGDLT